MSRMSPAIRSPEPIEEKGALDYRTSMDLPEVPAHTARRGDSVEQPPVATG